VLINEWDILYENMVIFFYLRRYIFCVCANHFELSAMWVLNHAVRL